MADLQGLCFFPGILQVVDASYTRSHGISPSSCQITCAPQEDPVSVTGDLIFTFGDVVLTFPDCKADLATARRNTDGLIWQLQILDRRWKWRFGTISGEYNRRDAQLNIIQAQGDGAIPSSEKSPQELAKLLFAAMGEENYDVSQLPADARPHVLWEDDNPASALADLCEQLGCHIVMQLDSSVSLLPIGEGEDLPDDNTVMENSLAVDSPETPDTIRVIGGPTLLQQRLLLDAVGRDTDGTWKLIDDLSYTPSKGWDYETNIFSNVTDDEARKLALQYIFKAYRVHVEDDGSIVSPDGKIQVKDLSQILPIHGQLVETFLDDGIEKPKPPNVWGIFWTGNVGTPLNSNQTRTVNGSTTKDTTSDGTNFPFKGRFQVLEDKAIVLFDEPIREWDSTRNVFQRCDLIYLECSFTIRDPETWELSRYSYDYSVPGDTFGTGPEIIKRPDEIQLKAYTTYDSTGGSPTVTWLVDQSTLDPFAKEFAEGAAQKYQTPDSQDATYAGLRGDIDLDGAILQITYTVGPSGATTRASRNCETHPYHPPFDARRLKEKLAAQAQKLSPYAAALRKIASQTGGTIQDGIAPSDYTGRLGL